MYFRTETVHDDDDGHEFNLKLQLVATCAEEKVPKQIFAQKSDAILIALESI
jgi:hypothetical protein